LEETVAAGELVGSTAEGTGFFLDQRKWDDNYDYLPPLNVSPDHSFISGIAAISPSPDWYTAFYLFDTKSNSTGTYWDSFKIRTYPWDAGTDDGTTYTSQARDTDPAGLVTRIEVGSKTDNIFVSPTGDAITYLAEWECVLHMCPINEPDCEKPDWPPANKCDILRYPQCSTPCDPSIDEGCEQCKREWNYEEKIYHKNCCLAGREPIERMCNTENKVVPPTTAPFQNPGGNTSSLATNSSETNTPSSTTPDEGLFDRPAGDIDFPGCYSDLHKADRNGDGFVKRDEYLYFIQEYGKRLCFLTDRLTLQQSATFNTLACICKDQEGSTEDCCIGKNAEIKTAGALTPIADQSPSQRNYLTTVCKLTDATIEGQCPPDGSPAVVSPISAPSPSTSEPVKANSPSQVTSPIILNVVSFPSAMPSAYIPNVITLSSPSITSTGSLVPSSVFKTNERMGMMMMSMTSKNEIFEDILHEENAKGNGNSIEKDVGNTMAMGMKMMSSNINTAPKAMRMYLLGKNGTIPPDDVHNIGNNSVTNHTEIYSVVGKLMESFKKQLNMGFSRDNSTRDNEPGDEDENEDKHSWMNAFWSKLLQDDTNTTMIGKRIWNWFVDKN
jgi:Spondin_N